MVTNSSAAVGWIATVLSKSFVALLAVLVGFSQLAQNGWQNNTDNKSIN